MGLRCSLFQHIATSNTRIEPILRLTQWQAFPSPNLIAFSPRAIEGNPGQCHKHED